MTREEAVKIIKEYLDDIDGVLTAYIPMNESVRDDYENLAKALRVAIEEPWVRTADREPTQEDADKEGKVLAWSALECEDNIRVEWWVNVSVHAEDWTYWMPIPPLPDHIADAGKKVADHA